MLFTAAFHPGLRDGSIDLTFRRWTRPQVKVGGTYRFGGGPDAVVVDAIEPIPFGTITTKDARRAGFDDLDALKAALRTGGATVTTRTRVYRIAFHFQRGTPKTAPKATTAAVAALVERLARMDRLSRRGPWTTQMLQLLDRHPQRRAGDLAPRLDRELRAFKADVRKLKGMGLTTSFEVGYELTPLGRRVLAARAGR